MIECVTHSYLNGKCRFKDCPNMDLIVGRHLGIAPFGGLC